MKLRDLTEAEEDLIQKLGDCFNDHQKLSQAHPSDGEEFATAIHAAQNIVMARPVVEQSYDPQP